MYKNIKHIGENMANNKKDLTKKAKTLIDDIMDNYEKYTAYEQTQIQTAFNTLGKLNEKLDKYDKKRDSFWDSFKKFFGIN